MAKRRRVKMACDGADTRPLEKLEPFQGSLKSLSRANFERLRKQILRLGFSEPVAVWEHEGKCYVLNGHQRVRVLQEMAKDGYEVPPVPVSVVEAKDIAEAKRKVLALTSQFGEVTEDGLYEFVVESGIGFDELEDFNFPEIDLTEFVFAYGPETPGGEGEGGSPWTEGDGENEPSTLADTLVPFECGYALKGWVDPDDADRLREAILARPGDLLADKLAAFVADVLGDEDGEGEESNDG